MGSDADRFGDIPADRLDDEVDKEELRQRYYGLLQELRVLLPGVQVLVAFLLTAPFAERFREVDDLGQAAFGVSLWAGLMAVISFAMPTVFHRIGDRRLRAARLAWGIRFTRAGLGFLGLALLAGTLVVTRFVFHPVVAWLFVASIAVAMVVVWLAIPTAVTRQRAPADREVPAWRR